MKGYEKLQSPMIKDLHINSPYISYIMTIISEHASERNISFFELSHYEDSMADFFGIKLSSDISSVHTQIRSSSSVHSKQARKSRIQDRQHELNSTLINQTSQAASD